MSTNETPPATAPQEEASKAPQDGSVHLVEIVAPFTDTYIYSNISALSASFMDVRISFGEIAPNGKPQTKVGVVMPPEHAAHLALTLLNQLNFFEKNFGKIRHPQWRALNDKAEVQMEALRQAIQTSKDAPVTFETSQESSPSPR